MSEFTLEIHTWATLTLDELARKLVDQLDRPALLDLVRRIDREAADRKWLESVYCWASDEMAQEAADLPADPGDAAE